MFGKIKLIVATRSGVGIILEYSLSTNPNSQIHKLCVKIPFSDPVDRTFEDFARRMKAWAPRDFSAYLVDQQELDWLLLLGWSFGLLNPSNIGSPQVSCHLCTFWRFSKFLWICFYQELEQEPEFEALQGSSAPLELDFRSNFD